MNIIDATTVSALLVVLALAVLATVVTAGVVLARVYGASRPTVSRPNSVPGRRTWPFPAASSPSVTDRPRPPQPDPRIGSGCAAFPGLAPDHSLAPDDPVATVGHHAVVRTWSAPDDVAHAVDAGDAVVARAADQHVGPGATRHPVAPTAAVERVVAPATPDPVVPGGRSHLVASAVAADVAVTRVQRPIGHSGVARQPAAPAAYWRAVIACPRSSAGQSSGLLIRRSQVRILSGAPHVFAGQRRFDHPRGAFTYRGMDVGGTNVAQDFERRRQRCRNGAGVRRSRARP